MEPWADFLYFLNMCGKKDKGAWEAFVRIYGNAIYHYILKTLRRYSYTYQEDEIGDIFNSIFLALLSDNCKKIRDFRGHDEHSFLAYLRVITFHITVDYLREKKTFIELEKIQNLQIDNENFEKLDPRDLKEIIIKLRECLPARYNFLFKLIYEEGFNFSEIAQIMNMKINAVHQLKFRMIRNIQRIARKKNLYPELGISIARSPCLQY